MRSSPRTLPRWAPLVAASLGQLMVVLDVTIVNVALPSMRHSLHLGAPELQWVVNAYLLTFGGLILLGGRLGDHFGRKRAYLIGAGIFILASFAGGVAPSSGLLIGARAAQGVGAALLAPGSLSLITSTYSAPHERARAIAIWGATGGAGAAAGVVLGGLLTQVASWRWVLFVNVPLGLIVVVLGGVALRETRLEDRQATRLDVPGALGITGAMALLIYGVVSSETHGWASGKTLIPLGISAVLMIATAIIEANTDGALIPVSILRRGAVATGVPLIFVVGAFINAPLFFMTLYLQQIRGDSPLAAGFLFLPSTLAAMGMAQVASRLATRFGPALVAIVGFAVCVVGLVWLSLWGPHSNVVTAVLLPSLLLAVGPTLCVISLAMMVSSNIENEHTGLGSGLIQAARQIGGSIGVAALTVIAATHTRAVLSAHSAAGLQATVVGYSLALRVGAVVAAIVACLLLAHLMRYRRRLAAHATHAGAST